MDAQRFDQLTQTFARRFGRNGGAEPGASARSADPPATHVAAAPPVVDGTCAPPGLTTAASGGAGQGLAPAICGWEHPPPTAPTSQPDGLPTRTGRAARRWRAQSLSAREQEVAGLIGQGLKDREIAAALVVSERTVHAHVRNVLDKLGLASRAQISAWVADGREHGPRLVHREQVEP